MPTQCFKCWKHGHVARMCRGTERCGVCATSGHATNDCMSREDPTKHRCAACPKPENHLSWAADCTTKKKYHALARRAYEQRPTRFQEHETRARAREFVGRSEDFPSPPAAPTGPVLTTSTSPAPAQRAASEALAQSRGEWTEVGGRKRQTSQAGSEPVAKRGPGRPRRFAVPVSKAQGRLPFPSTQ
jgi:hypothetical protein